MGTLQVTICSRSACWLSIVILSIAGLLVPVMVYFSYKNIFTRQPLIYGWFSIAFAAIISSIGGYFLERSTLKFSNIAMFQPLMSGLAGNRAAVQCSRLSTSLHIAYTKPGVVDADDDFKKRLNPWHSFNAKDIHSRSAWVHIGCALPSHLLFMSIIISLSASAANMEEDGNPLDMFNCPFIFSYLFVALIQVCLLSVFLLYRRSFQIVFLMYLSQLLVYILWRIGTDPDHSAIPIVTSISDFIGIGLLYGVFSFLEEVSPRSVGHMKLPISNSTCL